MNVRKLKSEQAILEAAAQVLVKNPGASTHEIAQMANVGRATLHRYFPKRDDLLKALNLYAIDATLELLNEINLDELNARDYLQQMLEAMIPLGAKYQFLMVSPQVFDQEPVKSAYEKVTYRTLAFIDKARSEGLIAADIPDAWALTAIDGLIYSAWAAVDQGYLAPRSAPGLVYRSLLSGLS